MFFTRCENHQSAAPAEAQHCHSGKSSGPWWKEQHHHHHHHHYYNNVDGALWGAVPQPKREHHCHRSRSFRPWCDKKNNNNNNNNCNSNSNKSAEQMQHNRFHGHCHLQDGAAARPRWFSHCKSRRDNVPKSEQMFDYSENYN
ncbi:hypothetical protein KR222_011755 [Zaprionus bogoriensis]|nr:hypothetical protein KR222_011755 [Zaprionus bogoriensis]